MLLFRSTSRSRWCLRGLSTPSSTSCPTSSWRPSGTAGRSSCWPTSRSVILNGNISSWLLQVWLSVGAGLHLSPSHDSSPGPSARHDAAARPLCFLPDHDEAAQFAARSSRASSCQCPRCHRARNVHLMLHPADWRICSPPYLEVHSETDLSSVHQAVKDQTLSFPLSQFSLS